MNNEDIKEILLELKNLREEVKLLRSEIKEPCDRMNTHISFVENIYSTIKKPISRILGIFQTLPEPLYIKNGNNIGMIAHTADST